MKSFPTGVLAAVTVLSLAGNGLLYMRYSSSRPLVTVGKDVITKKQFQDELENNLGPAGQPMGQEVLSKMVFSKLVTQAAAREGAMPTAKEVDDQIKDIQRRTPQALAPYNQDPTRAAELRQEIQTSLALDNLRIRHGIPLTSSQVAEYYAAHQRDFFLPQQVQTTTVVTQDPLMAQTAESLLHQDTPLDVLGRRPGMSVVGLNGYNPDLSHLPKDSVTQIDSFVRQAHNGAIKTFYLKDKGGDHYLTFRVTNTSPAGVPPLAQIMPTVRHQASLVYAPSPQMEIARLYHAANPTFSSDRYAAYFNALPNVPAGQDAGKKTASDR